MTARLNAVMRSATWVLMASGMRVPGMSAVPFPMPWCPGWPASSRTGWPRGAVHRENAGAQAILSRLCHTVPQEPCDAQSRVADADPALRAGGEPAGGDQPRATALAVDAGEWPSPGDPGRSDSGPGCL